MARAIHGGASRTRQLRHGELPVAVPGTARERTFGHSKGASPRHRKHAGRVAQADGGTLFLDEIGDFRLPCSQAARSCRTGVERVGDGDASRRRRIVAATNRDLDSMVATARSARICCIASTSSPCACRRCASVPRTCSDRRALLLGFAASFADGARLHRSSAEPDPCPSMARQSASYASDRTRGSSARGRGRCRPAVDRAGCRRRRSARVGADITSKRWSADILAVMSNSPTLEAAAITLGIDLDPLPQAKQYGSSAAARNAYTGGMSQPPSELTAAFARSARTLAPRSRTRPGLRRAARSRAPSFAASRATRSIRARWCTRRTSSFRTTPASSHRKHFYATAARRCGSGDRLRALAPRRPRGAAPNTRARFARSQRCRSSQATVVQMDAALGKLAELDPRLVRVVELRFSATGMVEIAELLGVSEATVKRDTRVRAPLSKGTRRRLSLRAASTRARVRCNVIAGGSIPHTNGVRQQHPKLSSRTLLRFMIAALYLGPFALIFDELRTGFPAEIEGPAVRGNLIAGGSIPHHERREAAAPKALKPHAPPLRPSPVRSP